MRELANSDVEYLYHITEVHVDQGISAFLMTKLRHNYQETLATVHIDLQLMGFWCSLLFIEKEHFDHYPN